MVDRYRTRHEGWNVRHFYSWYRREGGKRSYGWVKDHPRRAGAVPKSKPKGRGKHRKRRERAPWPGMMLHQDGSDHEWVEGARWDLIVTMDDATNEHYSMFFCEEEGARETIEAKGLFCSLYTDRGSHYWNTPAAGGKVDRENPTQFGRAMAHAGRNAAGMRLRPPAGQETSGSRSRRCDRATSLPVGSSPGWLPLEVMLLRVISVADGRLNRNSHPTSAPKPCGAREEGGGCLSIQSAFDSGLIQARQSHRSRGRLSLMAADGVFAPYRVVHPLPTINEPQKAMCWLTPRSDLDDDRKADMFLRSGLARIDNVFQKTRRLFNEVERPIGTSSTHNKVWHGYAPYNPKMLNKYLTIFRAVNNFVFVGDDGRTPAMRLGFAKQPLDFEDIVWPGQRVSRPKRARRRGRKAIAA